MCTNINSKIQYLLLLFVSEHNLLHGPDDVPDTGSGALHARHVEDALELVRGPRRVRQALPVQVRLLDRGAAQSGVHALRAALLAAAARPSPRRLPAQLHRRGGRRRRRVFVRSDGHTPPRQPDLALAHRQSARRAGAQRQNGALAHPLRSHESQLEDARGRARLHRAAARQGHPGGQRNGEQHEQRQHDPLVDTRRGHARSSHANPRGGRRLSTAAHFVALISLVGLDKRHWRRASSPIS